MAAKSSSAGTSRENAYAHEAGQIVRRASILNWDGEVISEMDLSALSEELGAPCVGIHRHALQTILLEALATPPRLGATVTSFTQDADSVAVKLADGTEVKGDVLIAADGIHSTIRAQLHGDGEPNYAGYTTWRGVCDNDGLMDPSGLAESWGEGSRFGLVPIARRSCTGSRPRTRRHMAGTART